MKKFALLGFVCIGIVQAQSEDTLLRKNDRFSIHGQTTVVDQFKPAFKAPYTGTNSLIIQQENKISLTATLFAGVRLWKSASIFINPEMAGGYGLSNVLGLGSLTNGETYRIGNPAPQVYLARIFFQQLFSLSKKNEYQPTDLNQLGGEIPTEYISLIVGQISLLDYFDINIYSHEARTQFMTWSLINQGAWDYPANTRGYSPSIVLQYVSPKNELRYALSLMPKEANGMQMDWDFWKSNSSTLEYVRRYAIMQRHGAVHLLAFFTTARMGNYSQAIALNSLVPNIVEDRKYGRTKYGFGISIEQEIIKGLGFFARGSWNDGHNETWAFTEIDHSISAGFSMNGEPWKRKNDNIGLAFVASGLSKSHQLYLKDGGLGFSLGDGNLNYAWENVEEFYYSLALLKNNIFLTGAYQLIVNPGYNKDRKGPVNVFSLRLHMQL